MPRINSPMWRAVMGNSRASVPVFNSYDYDQYVNYLSPDVYWPLDTLDFNCYSKGVLYPALSGFTLHGVSLGTGIGDGKQAYTFSAGYIVPTAPQLAALNAKLSKTMTISIVLDPAWLDGVNRYALRLEQDSNNYLYIQKNVSNNRLDISWKSGGVSKPTAMNITNRFTYLKAPIFLTITWSDATQSFSYYLNGDFVATVPGLGAWTAGAIALTTVDIGAYSNGIAQWSSMIAKIAIWNRILSQTEITNLFFRGWISGQPLYRFYIKSAKMLFTGSGAQDWLGRPVLLNNSGTWILMYRQGTQHATPDTCTFNLHFSNDEGATWSAQNKFTDGSSLVGAPFTNQSGGSQTDGILIKCPNGDILAQIYQKSTDFGTYQYRSADGGKTWTGEGKINNDTTMIGGQDWCTDGTNLYITTMLDPGGDAAHPWTCAVQISPDNGATWTVRGAFDVGNDGNESGIVYLGAGVMITVSRSEAASTTYVCYSSDYGATWTGPKEMGNLGILHRPRMKVLLGGILLIGRDVVGSNEYTVVYFSKEGYTFNQKFYPASVPSEDTGYCDVLQRANGDIYMVSYASTGSDSADIEEYIFNTK